MVAILPPTLEVFYAPTCEPCRLELPALAEWFQGSTHRLRIVIVSDDGRARSELAAISPGLARAAQDSGRRNPRDTLRAAGDADGILPFSRAQTANGALCASWRGALTVSRINNMLSACVGVTGRHSQRS